MSPAINFKKALPYIGLFFVTLIIAIFNSPYTHIPNVDVEVFRYIGMGIFNGKVLYKELFEHKPPIIDFIAAFVHPFGIWGFWFFAVFVASITSSYLYKLAYFYKLPLKFILPIIYLLLIFWQREFFSHYADTRFYSQALAIILCYYCLTAPKNKFILKGIIATLQLFTQQNDFLIAVVLIIILHIPILKSSLKIILKSIWHLIIGFTIVATPIFLYFILNNALPDFFYAVFTFNKVYFWRALSLNQHIFSLTEIFKGSFLPKILSFLLLTNFAIFFFYKKSFSRKIFYTALAMLLVAFINITITGHYSMYYTYNLILPSLLFFLNFLLFFANHPNLLKHFKIIGMVLLLPLLLRKSIIGFTFDKYKAQKFTKTAYNDFFKDIFDTLAKAPKNQQTLFVYNASTAYSVANKLDIKPQNKWVINYFWHKDFFNDSQFDADGSIFTTQILEPLLKNPPHFIICNSDSDRETSVYREDINNKWKSFLLNNYVLIKVAANESDVFLFRKKY